MESSIFKIQGIDEGGPDPLLQDSVNHISNNFFPSNRYGDGLFQLQNSNSGKNLLNRNENNLSKSNNSNSSEKVSQSSSSNNGSFNIER